MNIFVLDYDPVLAARMLCDQHVVKMIVESAQLLSTACGGTLKPTHVNHPCTKWAAALPQNAWWLHRHFHGLLREYTYRYDKIHAYTHIESMIVPCSHEPSDFVQCMPEEFKSPSPVVSYRKYYQSKAKTFKRPMRYTRRAMPMWLAA